MKRRIVIYDDDPRTVKRWKVRLKKLPSITSQFEIVPLGDQAFSGEIEKLEKRRTNARLRTKRGSPTDSLLDAADILIVDYDLLKTRTNSLLTGESVAYLARGYSKCGLIIALNQYGDNVFDLSLRGHPESYADLNLGSAQLDNPGLWQEPWSGFRPWSWPLLPDWLHMFESQVKQLKGHLADKILEFLGISDSVARALPRVASEYLSMKNAPERVTFEDFARSSGSGYRGKDKPLSEGGLRRVAAARVGKWLERVLLASQDLLVDAPHLASRYPSLLRGNPDEKSTWDRTSVLSQGSFTGLTLPKIEAYRFKKKAWLSRPAWFWRDLSNSERIREVLEPWSLHSAKWVFCEDISQFLRRDSALEFVADLPSPFVRRFVVNPAVKEGKKFAKKLQGVRYQPLVRFSL